MITLVLHPLYLIKTKDHLIYHRGILLQDHQWKDFLGSLNIKTSDQVYKQLGKDDLRFKTYLLKKETAAKEDFNRNINWAMFASLQNFRNNTPEDWSQNIENSKY